MIELNNLTKRYGDLTAIEEVSFGVDQGRIVGFLGPNGAGKTTTLKILTGFIRPTSGSIRVGGLDPARNPLEVRRMIGYLPEHVPLYLEMFVDEYLSFVGRVKGVGRRLKAELERVTEACGLAPVFRRRIGTLSKGYRQRVGLAQALLGDPEVLVLDEPTVGLDPTQIVEMRTLITSLGKDKTVILSSHILPEVSQTCDRVVIIAGGKVLATETVSELTGAAQATEYRLAARGDWEAIEKALAQVGCLTGLARLPESSAARPVFRLTVETGMEPGPEVSQALNDAGLGLLELGPVRSSLEEVFVRLVSGERAVAGEEGDHG